MITPRAKAAAFALAMPLFFVPLSANAAPSTGPSSRVAMTMGCDVPNVHATTTYAADPETPPIIAMMRLTGTTEVQVDLDATGTIVGTAVAKSSGIPALDRVALRAAQNSVFRPEVDDCQPVGGSYLFIVDFSP
jgi:TonB family protein